MIRVRAVAAVTCGLVLALAAACQPKAAPSVPPIAPPAGPLQWPLFRAPGAVRAIAVDFDGTVYVGGTFTRMGPLTGGGVPVSAADGTRAATFPKVDGTVYAAAPDGAGGWYVGGQFDRVGGQQRANLAHILADGSLDTAWSPGATRTISFWPGFEGYVKSLAFDGTTLYVAGYFDTLGGEARGGLGAVDAAGRVTAWAPPVEPPDGIRALALRGSTVYFGGDFATVSGEPRAGVAAVDAAGALTAWNPGDGSSTGSKTVTALAISGDAVFVGGWFDRLGGAARHLLGAVDAASGEATAWAPELASALSYGYVSGLAVDAGTLYVGGTFDTVDGQPRTGLAAFDASGALTAWAPALDASQVNAIAASGGVVYAGGFFWRAGEEARCHLAAFDASGALTAWDPDAEDAGSVYALVATGNTVYVGGTFRWIGKDTKRAGLAAIDPAGRVTSWNPGVEGTIAGPLGPAGAVYALAVVDGAIYVGGEFTSVGGAAHRNLAAVDRSGTVSVWKADADAPVFALAPGAGGIRVGGRFVNVSGVTRTHLAAVDASGKVGAWDPSPNGLVTTLAESGGALYVGGYFTAMGEERRTALAAFDASGVLLPWSPEPSGSDGIAGPQVVTPEPPTGIWSIAVDGSTVYVAGDFRSVGSVLRQELAAIDAASGAPTAFEVPELTQRGSVHVVGIGGGLRRVVAGGTFGARSEGHVSMVPSVALIDPGSTASSSAYRATLESELATVGAVTEPHVDAIAVRNGVTYVGGSFWEAGASSPRRFGLAALDAQGNVTSWDPNALP